MGAERRGHKGEGVADPECEHGDKKGEQSGAEVRTSTAVKSELASLSALWHGSRNIGLHPVVGAELPWWRWIL
jgi:hypothetical protein